MNYDDYFRINSIANDFFEESAQYHRQHMVQENLKLYFTRKYNVEYIPYRFKHVANNAISGCLITKNSQPLIFYNANMIPPRINFTCMHESAHLILHVDKTETQCFTDLLEGPVTYDDSEYFREEEANLLAGILMMNGDAFSYKGNMTFNDLSIEQGMSHAALYTRILQILVFERGFNFEIAKRAVNAYRYDNNSRMLSKNYWENTKGRSI